MANDRKAEVYAEIDRQVQESGLPSTAAATLKSWVATENSTQLGAMGVNNGESRVTVDSGPFQFNSDTLAGMRKAGQIPETFNPDNIKDSTAAAITYYRTRGMDKMTNPADLARAVNGTKASPEYIQRFTDNLTELPQPGSAGSGNISAIPQEVQNALDVLTASTKRHLAAADTVQRQYLSALDQTLNAIVGVGNAGKERILADFVKDANNAAQIAQTRERFMPTEAIAAWAAERQNTQRAVIDAAKVVAELGGVSLLDSPVDYIQAQLQLPAAKRKLEGLNAAAVTYDKLITSTETTFARQLDADAATHKFASREQAEAGLKLLAAEAAKQLGVQGIHAAKDLLGMSSNAQEAASRMLQIAVLPLEIRQRELGLLMAGEDMQNKRAHRAEVEAERTAQNILASDTLRLFGIPHTQETAKTTYDKVTRSPELRAMFAEVAASGTRGENVAEVLHNLEVAGAGLLNTDPALRPVISNLVQIRKAALATVESSVEFKSAKTPRERNAILSGAMLKTLTGMQDDVMRGGSEGNIYYGVSPSAFYGPTASPGAYKPPVTDGFGVAVTSALNAGAINVGSATMNSDIIHAILAAKKAGSYSGDFDTLADDLTKYFGAVRLTTNKAIGAHENRLPALDRVRSTIALSTDPKERSTPASWKNIFSGTSASTTKVVELTSKAAVAQMLAEIIAKDRTRAAIKEYTDNPPITPNTFGGL